MNNIFYRGDYMAMSIYFILGFFFVSITGTLAHFLYDFSDQNCIVGLFTPVNESTWEHMKLIFFPMLLYSLFTISKLHEQYPCVKNGLFIGMIIGTFLIPILFYAYTSVLGYNKLIIDVSIFYLSVFVAFVTAYWITSNGYCSSSKVISIIILLLTVMFIVFTYFPPNIDIFKSPV